MNEERKGKHCRRTWIVPALAALLWLVHPLAAAEGKSDPATRPATGPAPGRIRITISRKTTYILGPVNKDGTVNYVAYLNAKHSKGVTKRNNAAIPLLGILGPDALPESTRDRIYRLLKIRIPTHKSRFARLGRYVRESSGRKVPNAANQAEENLDKAVTGPWNAEKYPTVGAWIKANAGPLNAVLPAVKRTRYYMPAVSSRPDGTMIEILLPNISLHRALAKALVGRAMLKLDSGDIRGAWADLGAVRRLARLIGGGYTLIENLVGLAIEGMACSACNAMAGSRKLTGAQARAFLADMQRLGPMPDIVDAIDEGERFFMLDCVMMLARSMACGGVKGLTEAMTSITDLGPLKQTKPRAPAPTVLSLEWDEILLIANPWYDRLVAAGRKTTFRARTEALAAYSRDTDKWAVQVGKYRALLPLALMRVGQLAAQKSEDRTALRTVSRAIGNVLVALLLPAVERAVILRDRHAAQGDLSLVAMALAAYRAEKGAYPAKLSQLSPAYLKKIPDDLFVDKPLVYRRTDKGYVLYSVSENMKDDGGVKDEKAKKDDIAVRVE